MAIIIERTITIKNNQATLDTPLYLYIGDGDITCLFAIKEIKKAARFGEVSTTTNSITEQASYGEVRIYKPDNTDPILTTRAEIIDDKLQAVFTYDNIDHISEAGVHQLQIHLYDDETDERNRFTLPPVELNVLLPVGLDTALIDEALAGYSVLNVADESIPPFDGNGDYNKTTWKKGDVITQGKLNKIENALYEITSSDNSPVTEGELNAGLASKAPLVHSHTTANIAGLANVAKTGSYNSLLDKPNLDDYATKKDIPTVPTHTSQLTNNSGFITAADLPVVPSSTSQLINDSNFLSAIPSEYVTEDELLAKNYASKNYVDVAISDAQLSGGNTEPEIDVTNFATKDDLANKADISAIPSYTSQLINDSNFLTTIPLEYITDTELLAKDYASKDYVDSAIESQLGNGGSGDGGSGNVDLSEYAKLTDIPTNVSAFTNDAKYATEDYVDTAIGNAQLGGDGSGVDLSDYAKKTDIAGMVTSNTITRIEVVDALPETEEDGVLYIVKA